LSRKRSRKTATCKRDHNIFHHAQLNEYTAPEATCTAYSNEHLLCTWQRCTQRTFWNVPGINSFRVVELIQDDGELDIGSGRSKEGADAKVFPGSNHFHSETTIMAAARREKRVWRDAPDRSSLATHLRDPQIGQLDPEISNFGSSSISRPIFTFFRLFGLLSMCRKQP